MASSADQLERSVLDIGHWMSANRLKLNADKTELLFASSGHSLQHSIERQLSAAEIRCCYRHTTRKWCI